MATQTLGNISISGSGSAGGGDYDSIKISGSGKITGQTTCNEFKCSGSAKIENDIKIGSGKVSGSAKFLAAVTAEELGISGSATIDGPVNGGRLKASGSLKLEDSFNGEMVDVSGSIKIAKDCSTEAFNLTGGCQIGGLLNADQVDIKLGGRCEISSIGAENICVKVGHIGGALLELFSSLFNQDPYLYTDLIEGDDIYLENTICKMVRGKHVQIGRNCSIDCVEYSGSFEATDNAKVGTSTKL